MTSKSHQCSICKKSFSRPSRLQYHIAYHHEKKYPFECIECGKPYSNQTHVNRHYRTVHQQKNLQAEKFVCMFENCIKVFTNKQNLDRHIRLVHTKISRKLIQCLYCSELVDSLESHLITEHNSISLDKLKCLDCSKEFPSIKGLIRHRIIHTNERRDIDVQYTMKRLLDEIERKQIYKCDLCHRIFRSLFHLDQHRNSNIHENKFQCKYPNCGKIFRYTRNLQHHYKIHHEKISRLSCPMNSCSKTFTCQSSICRHLSKCHTTDDIIKQINIKQKYQSNISSLLSGFNHRKLNQENDLAQQMKSLLKLLLTDDNLIQIPNENIQTNINDNSFDSDLLKGYKDIGLIQL